MTRFRYRRMWLKAGSLPIVQVARHQPVRITEHAGRFAQAARAGRRAAGMKHAAGWRRQRIGKGEAEPDIRYAEPWLGREHRGEQRLRIGMARRAEDRVAL